MIYFCPNCWQDVEEKATHCSHCGYELAEYDRLSYEDKLLLALGHPVRENRMIAIVALGRLRSRKAVPSLRRVALATEDFHEAQAVVEALTLIGGADSETVLRAMTRHPSRLVRELAKRTLAGLRRNAQRP
ncbi:MAG: HEAT repeat domain-containing protein [Anaerolineae bacterium]|jgi:HEAT repeat protein|nr:HEAT repeat domain-containing protein [Anaerolineae bacterium]